MNTKPKITPDYEKEHNGTLKICLFYEVSTGNSDILRAPVERAKIRVYHDMDGVCGSQLALDVFTERDGCVECSLPAASYWLQLPDTGCAGAWGDQSSSLEKKKNASAQNSLYVPVGVIACKFNEITFAVPANKNGLALNIETRGADCPRINCRDIVAGKWANLKLENSGMIDFDTIEFLVNQKKLSTQSGKSNAPLEVLLETNQIPAGGFLAEARMNLPDGSRINAGVEGTLMKEIDNISGHITTTTTLTRTATSPTPDTALFIAINNATEALSFDNYLRFMDEIFCKNNQRIESYNNLLKKRYLPFTDADAYRVVKAATEAFVMVNCGVLESKLSFDPKRDNAYLESRDLPIPEEKGGLSETFNKYLNSDGTASILPYLAVIRSKLPDIPIQRQHNDPSLAITPNDLDECYGLLQEKLVNPCFLELIWSYWLEEGMLVQSMNAISRRFQNMRVPNAQDPLANLEMNPLRPLNNLMWGYIQDEQHRLNVIRRNYEYDHHYGLRLEGKAVQNFRPADTRSKFLEGFHHLLRLCTVFFKQDDDTTVKADAFPVLNALKEVHLILSEGAHNQFGDLPSTARIEMLMQQWFLARPEFREFLPTRIMVAYPEPWMDRVDAMKKLQGWTDTSVLHFRNLAVFGEQLLLSIRWGHWSVVYEPIQAFNWARLYRPQVQGYIHAYRAATSIDLSADPTVDTLVDATQPSVLLRKRLATQKRAS